MASPPAGQGSERLVRGQEDDEHPAAQLAGVAPGEDQLGGEAVLVDQGGEAQLGPAK